MNGIIFIFLVAIVAAVFYLGRSHSRKAVGLVEEKESLDERPICAVGWERIKDKDKQL